LLNLDAPLGAEVVITAVVGRLELRALIIHFGLKRKDLKATGICQHMTMPVGETVQTSETLNEVGSGFQHEVVGIAQDDFSTELLEIG
jgi:hypothetical protein